MHNLNYEELFAPIILLKHKKLCIKWEEYAMLQLATCRKYDFICV